MSWKTVNRILGQAAIETRDGAGKEEHRTKTREVFMMAPARFNSLSGKSQRAVAAHQMDFIFKQERKDNTDVSKSILLWQRGH